MQVIAATQRGDAARFLASFLCKIGLCLVSRRADSAFEDLLFAVFCAKLEARMDSVMLQDLLAVG